MRYLLLSVGLLVTSWSWIGLAMATPKPTKSPAPGAGALLNPTGAGALTGPTGAGALQDKWQTFKGPNVQLSLPANYRGGSPNTEGLQKVITAIKSFGPDYEQIAHMVEQNPSTFVLVAVDPKPNPMGGITNVVVTAATVTDTIPIDRYLDAFTQSLPGPIKAVEHGVVQLGQQPAGRLVTEASFVTPNARSDKLRQLIYFLQQGNTLWTIAYSTGATEYPQRVSTFEKSIQSLKFHVAGATPTPAAPSKPTAPKNPNPASTRTKPTAPTGATAPSQPQPPSATPSARDLAPR